MRTTTLGARPRRWQTAVTCWRRLVPIALLLLGAGTPAVAIERDWIMFQDPILPRPSVEIRFPPGLIELWLRALDQPDQPLRPHRRAGPDRRRRHRHRGEHLPRQFPRG